MKSIELAFEFRNGPQFVKLVDAYLKNGAFLTHKSRKERKDEYWGALRELEDEKYRIQCSQHKTK